jgi:hypothetical protein
MIHILTGHIASYYRYLYASIAHSYGKVVRFEGWIQHWLFMGVLYRLFCTQKAQTLFTHVADIFIVMCAGCYTIYCSERRSWQSYYQ